MPVAKPKAQELVDTLNDMRGAIVVNEMALARVEREAKQLLKVDAGHAYTILGMSACLREDEDSMRSNFASAMRLEPHNHAIAMNYALSLESFGRFEESADVKVSVASRSPEDVSASISAAQAMIHSGAWSRYVGFVSDFARRTTSPSIQQLIAPARVVSVLRVLDELKLSEQDLQKYIAASAALVVSKLGSISSTIVQFLDDGTVYFLYNFKTLDKAEVALEALLEFRIENAVGTFDEVFTVSSAVEQDVHQA